MIYLFIAHALGQILAPSTCDDEFRTTKLPNGLEVTLVHSELSSESGVSIAVNVGSSNDPIPGLAHFMEHMMFYSSKSFPQEDYWTTFINTHGGHTNAYTSLGQTVYFFSIAHQALQEGVHIVSRAFAEPIFSPEAARRELIAVKSEKERGLFDESNNLIVMLELILGSPFNKSTIGDMEKLDVANVTDYMYEFWSKYYVSSNMKICIVSNFSLDEVEDWVRLYFGDLKTGFKIEKIGYEANEKNYVVGDKVLDGDVGLVFWNVPGETWQYQEIDFLCYLVSYSLSKLTGGEFEIEKYFDNGQDAILLLAGFIENNEGPGSLFGVLLSAAVEVKQYSNETLYELWLDYRSLHLNRFLYSDPLQSVELAVTISENMLSYPEYLYYAGSSIKFYYSFDKIQSLLSGLIEEKASYVYSTDDENLQLNSYNDYYDFYYNISQTSFSPANIYFKHLEKNEFIPHSLKLVMNKFTEDCIQIQDSPNFKYWYKYNTSLRKPVVTISTLVITENWDQDKAIAFIHNLIVYQSLKTRLEYWQLAGYDYSIEVVYAGIEIRVTGWNEKILDFFNEVLLKFMNSDERMFLRLKSALIRYTQDKVTESYKLAIEYLNKILTKNSLTTQELIQKWKKLSASDYTYFKLHLKYSRNDFFVFGNTNLPNSTFVQNYFTKPSKHIEKQEKISIMVKNHSIFYESTQNQNALLNWYEFGPINAKQFAVIQIIDSVFRDKAFIYLRTQAQLGYTVALGYSNSFASNALYLIVQGASHSVEFMEKTVEEFWKQAVISQDELDVAKEMIKAQLHDNYGFYELFEINWKIILEPVKTKITAKMVADELENVSLSEVQLYLDSIVKHSQELSIRLSIT